MVVLTGASGFIGSCLLRKLNDEGLTDIVLVDDFHRLDKLKNLHNKQFQIQIHRNEFPVWLKENARHVHLIFHLGARTDTAEKDKALLEFLNTNYSKYVWDQCAKHGIPLIYASSAATYGDGALGFDDNHNLPAQLKPLNAYAASKNDFDVWALEQAKVGFEPPKWAGLKFFNVFGPNEYHKGKMASVVFHAARQISQNGTMKLFRSHKTTCEDGHQSRDFIYVKDVVNVCWFFSSREVPNGLYNVGSGISKTFLELTIATFEAYKLKPRISFIDIPIEIQATYQYFTQANLSKLRNAGYQGTFTSLEDSISDYVELYLKELTTW
jgi:ADP-L-glycero-D-manno-heptose 6-epimerase